MVYLIKGQLTRQGQGFFSNKKGDYYVLKATPNILRNSSAQVNDKDEQFGFTSAEPVAQTKFALVCGGDDLQF